MSLEVGKVNVEGIEDIMAYKKFLENLPSDFSNGDEETPVVEPKNEVIEQKIEEAGISKEELNEALNFENPNPEVVDKVYDAVINTQLTDEQIDMISDAIKEEQENNPDSKLMKEISDKIDSGELDNKGEFVNATVSVDPSTGEKQIVGVDEKEIGGETTLDDEISSEPIELDDSTINKSISDKFNISDVEIASLITVVRDYQSGSISTGEAFERLPESIKLNFNSEAVKAGVPKNEIKAYRNMFVKEMLGDIIMDAENDQLTVNLDKQLADIYREYGDNISVLYQSNLYDKIISLDKKIEDINNSEDDEEEKTRKTDLLKRIIHSLHQSYQLDDFYAFASHTKIKPFELEKPKKLYDDFKAKYNNSKYLIQDIENIIPVLQNHVGFDEVTANKFAILFCKYTRNMKSYNLDEHSFMYYLISNIITINVKGGPIDGENTPESYFMNVLINNIQKFMECYNKRFENPVYESEKIDKDHMEYIIDLAQRKAKEMEEVANEVEEETVEENAEESSENVESVEE